MKKIAITLVVLIATLINSLEISAQKFPRIDVSPMDAAVFPKNWKNSDKLVKIIYGRPQLKGRNVSDLAKASKKGVWRTGANEASEITFFKDVLFGEKEVKAGTYTLFTIPGQTEWIFVLSSVRNVWGHYTYDEKDDVVRAKGNVTTSDNLIEAFSITFEEKDKDVLMYLGWGNVIASISIKPIN